MITEAIILAGGLGTRLRSAVPHLPKCMAPVAGKPFIDYVLQYLSGQGIVHFVLALGYGAETIQQHIVAHFPGWHISFSVESEPLGTGGAIAQACLQISSKYALIANGDTLYKAKLDKVLPVLEKENAECILFAKELKNASRYGALEIAENGTILSFTEKQFFAQCLINGGLYVLDVPLFLSRSFPQKFSFEKDYLEAKVGEGKFRAIPDDGYFIDIGIPEDFERAQREVKS